MVGLLTTQPTLAHLATMSTFAVALLDRQFRILWSSRLPEPNSEAVGVSAFDILDRKYHDLAKQAFADCLIEGKVGSYVVESDIFEPTGKRRARLRIALYPVTNTSDVAMVLITHELHPAGEVQEMDRTILRMLANDRSVGDVAEALHRSESAIAQRIKAMKQRFGRTSLHGLVAQAVEWRMT